MKRLFDIVVATILLMIFILPLGIIILVVRLRSKSDALYLHTRIGKNGRPFEMYKIRTMKHGSDSYIFELADTSTPLFKVRDDPRVTPLGRYLRKSSIDELPQLFNVLKGDMSLVGPRPQIPAEVALYRPLHHARLSVRPGMTGLWQISGRSDLSFEEAVRLDIHYAFNHNLLMDIKIIAKTPFVLTKGAY